MVIPKGWKWFIRSVSFVETKIEKMLKFLGDKKEEIVLSLLQYLWPKWLLPNHLTAFRLLLSLSVICWLIWTKGEGYQDNNWLAAIVIIAVLTDFFDGPVARALKKESKLGSLFDKVVDKLLILPLGTVEFWHLDRLLVVLSIGGTFIVLVVSTYKYFQSDSEVPENILGKCGMVCYSLGIIIAIWSAWQNFALKIAWTGFAFGLTSIILNFRRHFGLGGPAGE